MRPMIRATVGENSFEERALNTLKEAGYRLTGPRLQVIRVLAESKKARSAGEIHQILTSGGARVDLVTVYRILSTLAANNLVHHIGLVDAYMACSLCEDHEDRSEHFVCKSCGEVTELSIPEESLTVARKHMEALGLSPDLVKVEVSGDCESCAGSKKPDSE